MKQFIFSILVISTIFLAACNSSDGPLTDEQKAQKYGLSLQEYQEAKEVSARMGMNVEDHLKSLQ